ncbi:MAG: phosphoadenylyl-sulfate reductase [Kineosporiaceae bacterium]|nr:phosphoadenylyl-sulfate reductase [Kineosporiaceae bacterium]
MTATALDAATSITEPATTSIPSTIPAPAGPSRRGQGVGSLLTDPSDVAAALADDPIGFARHADSVLEGADPLTVLAWAGRAFGRELAVTAAMGDTALAHLASRAVPGVHVLFVDTGYHFGETLGTADALATTYPVRLITVRAQQSVVAHEAEHGRQYRSDPDACCAVRKVAPLNQALSGYRAWATGLRRSDSPSRALTPTVQWDPRRSLLKLAPIATWTDDDLDAYLDAHPDVISNPLLQMGYPSIGCWPCTQPVAEGEDARSGRWAGRSKTECGIHYQI